MPRLRIMHKLFVEESQAEEVPQVEESTQEPEQIEEQPTPGFLDEFEYQYNKESQKVTSKEELIELAEMGRFYKEKGKGKLSELETELQKAQNSPEIAFLNDFLNKNGYSSFSEYQEALAISELKQQNEGLTDDMAKEILDGRRAREEQAKREQTEMKSKEQEAKQQADYADFISKYPDVKADDIDPEAFVLNKQGVPLAVAHELTQLRKGNDKTKIEQETLRKLQENSTQTTGSVTKGNPTHTTSVKEMSKADFAAKVAAVKRGEIKEL